MSVTHAPVHNSVTENSRQTAEVTATERAQAFSAADKKPVVVSNIDLLFFMIFN